LSRLNAIKGITIPDDAIARRPNIWLTSLADVGTLEQLKQAFAWVLEEIKRT
jgi:hypothetical protein